MALEENLRNSLPPHETLIPDEAIVNALAKVVEAKRDFANTVKVITGSLDAAQAGVISHRFASAQDQVGDIDAIMQPVLLGTEHARGMTDALDLLARTHDGTPWDHFATAIAETPTDPEA